MATVKPAIAIAIMLAIWNFASTEGPICMDIVEPGSNMVHLIRLQRGPDGYSILTQNQGEWIQSGEIAYDPARPTVFHFGGRDVSPAIDIAQAIPDFASIQNASMTDVAFKGVIGDESVELRQVRSEGIVILVDTESNGAFIVHAGK